MRAAVWTQYGSPEGLQLAEVPKPVPKDNQLLIRIHATSVTAGDVELRALRVSTGLRLLVRLLMGLSKPRRKVLGQEFSGEVEAVGDQVRLFHEGDQLFGTTGFGFGAYAEYLCLPETGGGGAVAIKPSNLSYEEAATIPTGGLEALHLLRKAGTLSGRRVLILGAGGGIGTMGIQLAKYFGAGVTGVDTAPRLDLIRSLGADRVVDYTREHFADAGVEYDAILDVVGKTEFADCMRSLTPDGHLLLANPNLAATVRGFWISRRSRRKVISGAAPHRPEDLTFLRKLIEAGRIRAVIARTFTLEEISEAHRYFESGQAAGRIVVTV